MRNIVYTALAWGQEFGFVGSIFGMKNYLQQLSISNLKIMSGLLSWLLIFLVVGNPVLAQKANNEFAKSSQKMGSYFEVIAIDTDSVHAYSHHRLSFSGN